RVSVGNERHVSYPRQSDRDLVLGGRRDGRSSLVTDRVSCAWKCLVEHVDRLKGVAGEGILCGSAEVSTKYRYVDGRLLGTSWSDSGRGFSCWWDTRLGAAGAACGTRRRDGQRAGRNRARKRRPHRQL